MSNYVQGQTANAPALQLGENSQASGTLKDYIDYVQKQRVTQSSRLNQLAQMMREHPDQFAGAKLNVDENGLAQGNHLYDDAMNWQNSDKSQTGFDTKAAAYNAQETQDFMQRTANLRQQVLDKQGDSPDMASARNAYNQVAGQFPNSDAFTVLPKNNTRNGVGAFVDETGVTDPNSAHEVTIPKNLPPLDPNSHIGQAASSVAGQGIYNPNNNGAGAGSSGMQGSGTGTQGSGTGTGTAPGQFSKESQMRKFGEGDADRDRETWKQSSDLPMSIATSFNATPAIDSLAQQKANIVDENPYNYDSMMRSAQATSALTGIPINQTSEGVQAANRATFLDKYMGEMGVTHTAQGTTPATLDIGGAVGNANISKQVGADSYNNNRILVQTGDVRASGATGGGGKTPPAVGFRFGAGTKVSVDWKFDKGGNTVTAPNDGPINYQPALNDYVHDFLSKNPSLLTQQKNGEYWATIDDPNMDLHGLKVEYDPQTQKVLKTFATKGLTKMSVATAQKLFGGDTYDGTGKVTGNPDMTTTSR